MDQKALILGITGTLGQALAADLLEHGWEVYGAARFSGDAQPGDFEKRGISVTAFDVTADDPTILPDVDVVFLEIWDPGRPELHWPINFYGVGGVVERYAGTTDFINGCTINVYGDSPEQATEKTPCRPTSDYGRSRYAQERLIDYFCHGSDSDAIHLRYAHANSNDAGIVQRMARTIADGQSLGDDPGARLQVIAREDIIRVTRLAVERTDTPPPAVNCCHPRVWSKRELAEEIHRRLGRGTVGFEREEGGLEASAYADASRMLEWFGPPRVPLDRVIDRAVEAGGQ